MEAVHAVCSACHSNDACVKCHDAKEKAAFTHASTGWPLNRFHESLSCRACHPTGKLISRLNRECTACHNWRRDSFQHELTGLQLDEIHVELDCADCHLKSKFGESPACSNCHDDNRNPQTNPPGKYIKVASR
jgi:hypothetical protein